MNPFAPLIADELNLVERTLQQTLTGSQLEEHVNTLCLQMVNAGGKRIRPTMVLLCAHALPDFDEEKDGDRSILMAAAIELLHTATLIHDDVIDNSTLRRGVRTINDTSGNHAAVLAGDYLFTRCFNLLRKINHMGAFAAVSDTIATLVAGELLQLEKEGYLDLTPEDYHQTIYCKTGALFELSASALAITRDNGKDSLLPALKAYGRLVGAAFQIADDNLDYSADTASLGKQVGIDLADGRITLPVILALQQVAGADHQRLSDAIAAGDFAVVKDIITSLGTLDEAKDQALSLAASAKAQLQVLPDTPYRKALATLADMAVKRGN